MNHVPGTQFTRAAERLSRLLMTRRILVLAKFSTWSSTGDSSVHDRPFNGRSPSTIGSNSGAKGVPAENSTKALKSVISSDQCFVVSEMYRACVASVSFCELSCIAVPHRAACRSRFGCVLRCDRLPWQWRITREGVVHGRDVSC